MSTSSASYQVAAFAHSAEALHKALEPSPRTRVLTLADHDHIVLHMQFAVAVLLTVLEAEGRSLTRSGDEDLGNAYRTAAASVRSAAKKAEDPVRLLGRTVRALPKSSGQRRLSKGRRPCQAALEVANQAERLDGVTSGLHGDHAVIADRLHHGVTSLQGAFSCEATLLDWACEENGMSRSSALIGGPIASAISDLRNAALHLSVPKLVLRDSEPAGSTS